MKLYVLSDLHAESAAFLADPAALEEADVVVLAGDIHCGEYTPFWARKTFGDKPSFWSPVTTSSTTGTGSVA